MLRKCRARSWRVLGSTSGSGVLGLQGPPSLKHGGPCLLSPLLGVHDALVRHPLIENVLGHLVEIVLHVVLLVQGLAEVALEAAASVPALHIAVGKLVPQLLGHPGGIEIPSQRRHHEVALVGIQVRIGEEVPPLDELGKEICFELGLLASRGSSS